MGDFVDLIVYQKAFRLTMDIFEITEGFLLRRNTALQTRSGARPGQYVLILWRPTEGRNTDLTLFQN